MRRLYIFPFVLLLLLSLSCFQSDIEKTEILWDEWGVPHIYAPNNTDLFYATGWAQMESHGNLILQLYGESRGRAAEYWGEQHLDSDRWVRTVGIPERGNEWYTLQTDSFKRMLQSFTDGINDYARKHSDRIDEVLKQVLPVTPEDILSHTQRVIHFTFIANPAIVPAVQRHITAGSNSWAIAPSRTESGNAMLLINPHLPWSEDLFRFYELHLVTPDVNLYGATLVGLPGVALGFNEYLGWAHTVNTIDAADQYILSLTDDGGYIFDSEVRRFEEMYDTILVKVQNGDHRREPITIRQSIHGPVIAHHKNRAVALRVAGLDAHFMLDQWWNMGIAQDLDEFKIQLQRMQLPMFTVIYADRDGNILHFFAGQVPVREQGDWNFWQGIVPGDTSATLWTEIHTFNDLPLVVNPSTGWLQNSNDPPWTTTFPLEIHPDDYPPYMAPVNFGFRAQRSARLLMENDGLSFNEMVKLKHDTRMKLADRVLDDLLDAIECYGGEMVNRASELLSEWDRTADAESCGSVLFTQWAGSYNVWQNFESPFDLENPFDTPSGLADPQNAVMELERVAEKLEGLYGSIDINWGELNRLRIDEYDFPASGGPARYGIFHVLGFDQIPSEEKRHNANFGESFIAAVEFSEPLRAQVLTSYGNATQGHLPHRGNQLEFLANKQLRNALIYREDVEENSVKKIDFKR